MNLLFLILQGSYLGLYFERRSAGRNQFITEMRDLKIANIRRTEKENINILFMKGNNN